MKLPKEIKITKENSGGFMRPAEAVDYLNVSLFTIHHNLVSKLPIYAKRGDEFVVIEGYEMPLVDMANLPKQTNEKKNYDLYHLRKKQ